MVEKEILKYIMRLINSSDDYYSWVDVSRDADISASWGDPVPIKAKYSSLKDDIFGNINVRDGVVKITKETHDELLCENCYELADPKSIDQIEEFFDTKEGLPIKSVSNVEIIASLMMHYNWHGNDFT